MVYAQMGGGVLILTEGGEGALLYSKHGIVHSVAHTVENVADTVGAGDTFHSVFLANLFRSNTLSRPISEINLKTLDDALDFAGASAAIEQKQ